IGPNGAGKTTLLRTISGLIKPYSGKILFKGIDITNVPPHKRTRMGIAHVPEGRGIFPNLTVLENLKMGAYVNRHGFHERVKEIFKIFPALEERKNNLAKTLSGGESQMLAIARALISNPSLLMLDEPSLGLAPKVVEVVYKIIDKLHRKGLTIVLVEQNIELALSIADKAYVLENGRIVLEGKGKELLNSIDVRKHYLGMY
ncbi:MAG: branched-chain amino acid ABC transporter ATP-binding protein, partial [Thermoprotei archaeon]